MKFYFSQTACAPLFPVALFNKVMTRKKYTAAIIGLGRIGFSLGFDFKREQPASHTMTLKKNNRIKLIAGCDSSGTRLAYWQRFNKKCGAYSDCDCLFAAIKPDIAVVAVNEISHKDTVLAAIRAKPCLVILEKPVALTMEEGLRILAESESLKVPVLVNHERRFAEDYKIAKKYMQEIGEIQTVNARLDSGLYVYNPEKEQTGEYSLLHDGTHLVDIVSYLLEEKTSSELPDEPVLKNMNISNITYDKKNPHVVRNINVHFESKKCSDVNIFMSGRSRFFGFEVEVVGTEGRFRIGNGIYEFQKRAESKLYSGFYSLTDDKKVKIPKKTKYFSNMVENAVQFLDGKEPLRSTLQTGLNSLSILENIKNHIKATV